MSHLHSLRFDWEEYIEYNFLYSVNICMYIHKKTNIYIYVPNKCIYIYINEKIKK